jgi:site-specific recombinase XerD
MTEQQAIQKMWEDFRLRGLSESTFRNYTRRVKEFIAFCNRPIEELDETDARKYLSHMITERRLAPKTVNQASSSIRFFFAVGLNRNMNYLQMPMMKTPYILPDILTREEIAVLIDACLNAKHKALILLAYGSGLRTGEIQRLRVKDIDSQNMRIFVKGFKTNRDHYTVLSQTTLDALREYWREYRPNSPEGWLFPGFKTTGHITRASVSWAFTDILHRTNIGKTVTTHTLRHSFATHMIEDGVDLMKVKEMLGHARVHSTTIYVHLANTATKGIKSPADSLGVPND